MGKYILSFLKSLYSLVEWCLLKFRLWKRKKERGKIKTQTDKETAGHQENSSPGGLHSVSALPPVSCMAFEKLLLSSTSGVFCFCCFLFVVLFLSVKWSFGTRWILKPLHYDSMTHWEIDSLEKKESILLGYFFSSFEILSINTYLLLLANLCICSNTGAQYSLTQVCILLSISLFFICLSTHSQSNGSSQP